MGKIDCSKYFCDICKEEIPEVCNSYDKALLRIDYDGNPNEYYNGDYPRPHKINKLICGDCYRKISTLIFEIESKEDNILEIDELNRRLHLAESRIKILEKISDKYNKILEIIR